MTEPEVAALTRELVAVPADRAETATGDRIEDWLRTETDAAVTRDDAPRGGNVLARRGDGDVTLALVGHHDVVPPADGQVDDDAVAVETRERGDDARLVGRGTADMKGAVAAMLLAFRDADPPDGLELAVASFVGEEDGGVGARHAVDVGFVPEYAVVGEGSTGYSAPGVTDVAVAHKGRRGATVVATGEAAHASEAPTGANAVYRACDAVDVVRELAPPAVELAGERVAGSVTVTEMAGGGAWNVVPDRCTATVDERTVPGERAPLERVEDIEGVSLRVDQDLPPMACGDDAFADAALAAADAVQDGAPERVVKPHATDAGWLAAAGTESVVAGPAEPGEAHTDDESVSIAVLERCRALYRRVAESPGGTLL